MGAPKIIIPKQILAKLYLDKNLTPLMIGKKFGCSFKTITNRLVEYKIPLKDPAFARMRYSKKDFDGSLAEKAYMVGFRIGDLNVYKKSPNSKTIVVRCHTTQEQQLIIINSLFKKFGRVTNSFNSGHYHTNCFLNDSFGFLISKDFLSWKWIRNCDNKNTAFGFIAGYTDAEGNFILNQNRARFKIDSYDFEVLNWFSLWLAKNGIYNKFRCIYKKGESVRGYNYSFKKDLWRLNINEMSSLRSFILNILPFLRHATRIQDAKVCLKNIYDRS